MLGRDQNPALPPDYLREPRMRAPDIRVQWRHGAFWTHEETGARPLHELRHAGKPVEKVIRHWAVGQKLECSQEPVIAYIERKRLPVTRKQSVNDVPQWCFRGVGGPIPPPIIPGKRNRNLAILLFRKLKRPVVQRRPSADSVSIENDRAPPGALKSRLNSRSDEPAYARSAGTRKALPAASD